MRSSVSVGKSSRVEAATRTPLPRGRSIGSVAIDIDVPKRRARVVAGHRCGSWPSDRRSSSFNAVGSVGPPPRATAPRSSSSSATSARSSLSNDKTSSASEALISGARHSDHEAERASRSSKSPRRSRKHAISRSRSSRAAVPVTAHRGRRVAGPRRNRLAPATHQEMHLARRRGASSRPGSNSPDSSSVSHRSPGHGRSSSEPRVTATGATNITGWFGGGTRPAFGPPAPTARGNFCKAYGFLSGCFRDRTLRRAGPPERC